MASNLENLKTYLGSELEENSDDLLTLLLKQADAKIINKRFPFGATETEKEQALKQYEDIELNIAVYLYNKRGAEGEKSHSENGISRSYDSVDEYLKDIIPYVGVL